jgi:hypothetical protein
VLESKLYDLTEEFLDLQLIEKQRQVCKEKLEKVTLI